MYLPIKKPTSKELTEGIVIDLTDGAIEWEPQLYETQEDMKSWNNNMNMFFNFNIKVNKMSVGSEIIDPRVNKIWNIRPKTDISTPPKVSWTEPSHEWRSNNGIASTTIVSTCQEHGCTVKYFEKDQWNF